MDTPARETILGVQNRTSPENRNDTAARTNVCVAAGAFASGEKSCKTEAGMGKTSKTALHTFIERAKTSRRLGFGDLRRLKRDVLPQGLASYDEAEALIGLHAALDKADEGWPGFMAAAVKGFVLTRSTPPGRIGPGAAEWLLDVLGALPPRIASAIVRELVQEAKSVDTLLLDFLGKGAKGKPCGAMPCRRARDPRISCSLGALDPQIADVPEIRSSADRTEPSEGS
jgi:hypothetical protein